MLGLRIMKSMWLIGGIILIIVVLFAVFSDLRRLAAVGYLVVRVTPYEQTIPGSPTILVAGDSTGYGTGASSGAKSVAGYVGDDFPEYSIENMSVNGRTIGGLVQALESRDPNERYRLILLQIGGNDILRGRSEAEIETDLRALLALATERGEQVVMMSSGNVGAASAFVTDGKPDPVYEKRTRAAREIFLAVTEEFGVTYVDLFLEPVDDVFLKEPKKYLAFDGLHPSSFGYYYWYQSLQPELERLLNN